MVLVHVEGAGDTGEVLRLLHRDLDGLAGARGGAGDSVGDELAEVVAEGVEGVGLLATEFDIAKNPKNIQVRALEAAQLPRILPEVDLAVINTNYALPAGLVPNRDALFIEGAESPYANVLAVRTADQNKPALQKLAQALNSPEIKAYLLENYSGDIVPAF